MTLNRPSRRSGMFPSSGSTTRRPPSLHGDVLVRALGKSFAGTLVSDFYAVYNGLACAKQRCLVHLLRELAKLREELPGPSVRAFIQPLITLFQDAIQLGKDRDRLGKQVFAEAHQRILDRFDDLMLN